MFFEEKIKSNLYLIPVQIFIFLLFGFLGGYGEFLCRFFDPNVIGLLAIFCGIGYAAYLYFSNLILSIKDIKNEKIIKTIETLTGYGKRDFLIIFLFGILLLIFTAYYPHIYIFDTEIATGAYLLSEAIFILTKVCILCKYYIALNRQIIREYKEQIN